MQDKRSKNGGNSTKSNRPDDKRKNKNKALIEKYIQEDFGYDKLKELMDKLLSDGIKGDTKSSALFLSYIVGKPKEEIQEMNPIIIWKEERLKQE